MGDVIGSRQLVVLVGCFLVLLFGTIVGIVLYVQEKADERAEATERERLRTDYLLCVQSQTNRAMIRAVVAASDPLDIKPGEFLYAYAQEHPQEAANTSEAIRLGRIASLKEFGPIECPPNPFEPAKP